MELTEIMNQITEIVNRLDPQGILIQQTSEQVYQNLIKAAERTRGHSLVVEALSRLLIIEHVRRRSAENKLNEFRQSIGQKLSAVQDFLEPDDRSK